MKNFWEKLDKPVIALAPMDGYTDSAFRRICKSVNKNLILFTEFTSADGIFHNAKIVKKKLHFEKDEQPIIAQIFGKNTETFKEAARVCEQMGFSGIDLNMGCPAKKVVRSEHGVFLRKTPVKAFELVHAVSNVTLLPVSVKTRLGWSNASDLIEFGKGCEAAGADLLTIHGRTYKTPYSGPADFEPVYELKKAVSIPVIGNGGITSYQDGMKKLGNLDGFMIGQAAFGNPWVFSETGAPASFKKKVPLIKKHAKYLIELKGIDVGTREIRKHLLAYVKGFPNAANYRKELVKVTSLKEIEKILDKIAMKA